jgi:hypothetical protein
VGVSFAAAISASRNDWSSAAFLSMKPRSPPWSLVASVDTDLATVSQTPPPLRVVSAWSAFAFAAAFSASVATVSPVASVGCTAINQAWRSSGVVASSVTRASISAWVIATPCLEASCSMTLPSISCSSAIVFACCVIWSRLDMRACASAVRIRPAVRSVRTRRVW